MARLKSKPSAKAGDERRENAGAAPDLERLRKEWQRAIHNTSDNLFRRQRTNYEARFCLWPGQSDDGRRWTPDRNGEIIPWPGASDARVPVLDSFINEDVALLMMAWSRNKILVHGTETSDEAFANRLTQFLRWMKYTQMPEAYREQELLANIMLERGTAIKAITWRRQFALCYDTFDMEEAKRLAQLAAQSPLPIVPGVENAALAYLPLLLADPLYQDDATEILLALAAQPVRPMEGIDAPESIRPRREVIARAVAELRERGFAQFPRPKLIKNRPEVMALIPNEEFFVPPETTSLQEARTMFWVEQVSEATLRERVLSHGWSAEWVDEMVKTQRGRLTTDVETSRLIRQRRNLVARSTADTKELYEVIHGYQRLADENDVPGIYYTVFSNGIGETAGFWGLLNYQHGKYPFVMFERETRARLFGEARGYGEVGSTWQNQIKAEWDMQVDRGALTTLPPFFHPFESPLNQWGPGLRVPTNRKDEYGFADIPAYDATSDRISERAMTFAKRYFGRQVEEQPRIEPDALRQKMLDKWLRSEAESDTQLLQLCQQFMDSIFYFRVVGSSKGRSIKANLEEIQGGFDVTTSFSAADLDQEHVKAKLELIEKSLAMDRTGRVDANEVLEVIFDLIDPGMGERLLVPAQAASAAEIKDESEALSKALNGIAVPVQAEGQNWQLRLQWLEQELQRNPTAQRKIMEDENVKASVEMRVKQHQFQIQQHQVNPLIGIQGPQKRDAAGGA